MVPRTASTSSRSVWLDAGHLDGVRDLGQRSDRPGDHHVDAAVLGVGVGGELGPAADAGAVADRDHQHRLVEVVDDLAVDLDAQVQRRRHEGGLERADRVADLAEVQLADPDGAEPGLPAGPATAGLRAGPDVHVVDHDLAGLVDDQVDRPHLALEHDPGGLLDVERDVHRAGEVVAGAHRQQPEHRALEVVAAVQRRHHRVQAAVAAGHDDAARAGAVQHAVELAGVRRRGHLDRGPGPQHLQALLERRLGRCAGVAVHDDEQGVHTAERRPTVQAATGRGAGGHGAVASDVKSPAAPASGLLSVWRRLRCPPS